MKCFPDHKQHSYKTRHSVINNFFKGFQIFGRFYVVWYKIPYFISETSEAFSTIINLIYTTQIFKFHLYLSRAFVTDTKFWISAQK